MSVHRKGRAGGRIQVLLSVASVLLALSAALWATADAPRGAGPLALVVESVPLDPSDASRQSIGPLVYQGGSDDFLPPQVDAPFASEDWGIDLEGEVAVVTDDVPMGTDPAAARGHIQLLMLVNDWSLRNLIPAELAKGFGFYQSKPATAFSPVAVTPDELGDAWRDARVHLPLVVHLNGKPFGRPDAGTDMTFDFGQLIAHAAKTRRLGAGSIVGSGTVSNRDRAAGSTCLAERRMLETLDQGKPMTPFLSFGDRVRIEMFDAAGNSIFGAIDQRVARAA